MDPSKSHPDLFQTEERKHMTGTTKKLSLSALALSAVMLGMTADERPRRSGPFGCRPEPSTRSKHRPGPCEICGQPNVKAGRERGVYRCAEHLEGR